MKKNFLAINTGFIFLLSLVSCANVTKYSLTIIDDEKKIIDVLPSAVTKKFRAGTKITMYSYPINDASLSMYVDDVFYTNGDAIETDNGYLWEYTFTMPEKDTTVKFIITT